MLAAVGAAGCYSYAAVPPQGSIPAGTEVRVELTPVGASRLVSILGPRAVRVDGRVAAGDGGGALTVIPVSILSMDGMQTAWAGDAPLRLDPDAVASVSRRQFSRRRTLVAAGSVTAAAVAVGVIAARRGGDKGGDPANPPPPPPP